MTHSHLICALVGVGVTALVYQLFVLPGVSHGQGLPAAGAPVAATAPAVAPAVLPALPPAAIAAEIRDKEQALEALQAQLGRLRADHAESQRRLEATEGKAQGWPAGLPAGYRSEVLEANLNKFLDKSGLGSLADIDCDEFPCIAVISAKEQDAGWSKRLEEALMGFVPEADLGKQVSTSMFTSRRQEGDKQVQLSAVVLAPSGSFGDEQRRRAGFRAQAALSGVLGEGR
jgi:hypothetical protein